MGVENKYHQESWELLKHLIRTPSFSRQEKDTAEIISSYLKDAGLKPRRTANNVWVEHFAGHENAPTLLLNSHHDTVKPSDGWTVDPFGGVEHDNKLIGLGANDAGASLVSLLAAFQTIRDMDLSLNIIFAASAEEEISGANGIEKFLKESPEIDFAIVGEPTGMKAAVAEKGLMVLDCTVYGRSGHAARDEGENALLNAMKDIAWFRDYSFDQTSEFLGPIRMSPTMIKAGTQHNVVPDRCEFVVDVRTTNAYTNEETLDIIRKYVDCEVKPRSTRLQPSSISMDHPLREAAIAAGCPTYGSPTLSDQALMPFPSIKIGPGDSARSHTPDEFILKKEVFEGINLYIEILTKLNSTL